MTYRATAHGTIEDKERFEAAFKKFVEGGYQRKDFTAKLYERLSNCFGHIAHYDRHGFFETQFSTQDRIEEWEKRITYWKAHGSPGFTYSDVEQVLSEWMGTRLGLAIESWERQMYLG